MKTYRPTEKTKEKISKSLKGKLPANHRMLVLKGAAATSKKVIRFTKDGKKAGEFVSISEAARCMGITPASISVAIKKKTPSKNYYWKYGA